MDFHHSPVRLPAWKKRLAIFLVIFLVAFAVKLSALDFRNLTQIFIPKSDVLHYSLQDIGDSYFDPARIKPNDMYRKALEGISNQVPPVLVQFSDSTSLVSVKIRVGDHDKTFEFPPLKNLGQLESKLEEAFQFIKGNLSSGDLENLRDIDYAAVNGILSTLDPHSNLFTPQYYQDFNADAQGSYGGVGMVIRQKEDKIQVMSIVSKASPAYKAGIQSKDLILQIDQSPTAGMDVEEAKNRLRGPKGTKIHLLVQRSGRPEPIEYNLVRDEIRLVSVESYSFKDNKSIGYIRMSREIGSTSAELKANLTSLATSLKDFKGLILDLRSNPGGLLNEAIEVSNSFLTNGVIVSIAGMGQKNIQDYKARPYAASNNYPIIVLVNRYSASAAEIIAAALQKNKRALLIGETTFGKGSVQTIVSNFSDGSALKLTTSQYLTPGHESIQGIGVVPEVALHAVVLKPDLIQMIPIHASGENELENSLQLQDATYAPKSLLKLDYLFTKDTSASDLEVEENEYGVINPRDLEQDYVVQTARKILAASSSADYEALVSAAKKYVGAETQSQQKAIAGALKKFSIHWEFVDLNQPHSDASADLVVKYSFERKTDGGWKTITTPFPPKSKGRLVVEVTNKGKDTYYRLVGQLNGKDGLLAEKQLVFGDLKPDESRTWRVPFETSLFEIARASQYSLDLYSYPNKQILEKDKINEKIAAAPQPVLEYGYSYSAQVADLHTKLVFDLKLNNNSDLVTGPVVVTLKNADIDVLALNRGRVVVPSIAAHGQADATFEFNLVDLPKDKEYNLLANVSVEGYPLLNFNQKIAFAPGQKLEPFSNRLPVIAIEPTIPGKEFTLKANIKDDTGIKDLYVFQNNQKIFYTRLSKLQVKDYNLNLPVTLKEKETEFVILASDIYDVRAQNRIRLLSP